MKRIEFSVNVIRDNFTIYGADPETNLEDVVTDIVRQIEGSSGLAAGEYKLLIAHQITNPKMPVPDVQMRFPKPEMSLQEIVWEIASENLTLEDLKIMPVEEEGLANKAFRITNKNLSMPDLKLRPLWAENSLQDHQVENGTYFILIRPNPLVNKLGLFLSSQPDAAGWVVQDNEVLIGRKDVGQVIDPDIDLTPYLRNPLKISRRQAWLIAEEGRWRIRLHPDARSQVFINNRRLEPDQNIELRNDTVLFFGGSPENPELTLYVRLLAA